MGCTPHCVASDYSRWHSKKRQAGTEWRERAHRLLRSSSSSCPSFTACIPRSLTSFSVQGVQRREKLQTPLKSKTSLNKTPELIRINCHARQSRRCTTNLKTLLQSPLAPSPCSLGCYKSGDNMKLDIKCQPEQMRWRQMSVSNPPNPAELHVLLQMGQRSQ